MRKKKADIGFPTVRTQGAILPADLLERIAELDQDLAGLKQPDYGLAKTEKIGEAISRSWNRMRGIWIAFKEEADDLLTKEALRGTTGTRENWLLPLFQELGYGKLETGSYDIEGKSYPISHEWGHSPIHLVSFKIDLDRRTPGVAGAARSSPHSLVQEFLNRSDDHLWAFLSNGFKLRILRDNVSLTRLAFVEFDLESMMEGEAYADFSLLWLLCHRSRVEADVPESCYLEQWSSEAHEQGTRALDRLREGVEEAIRALGSGFLAYDGNQALREQLRSGALDKQDYFREVLRLVYRLIFLFAAEDRDQLFGTDALVEKRDRYDEYFSMSRLRRMAGNTRGSRHPDLYRMFRLLASGLGSNEGIPRLGLAGLGSYLWSNQSTPHLETADLSNASFLKAIRSLAFATEDGVSRSIDYRNLGPEELGSVYESLLELQPELHLDSATFKLSVVSGSERKTTGSYYTNERLIQALLDTSLDPLLDEAERSDDPEHALLDLKVCDPACGSGHFLIAAAHRIAERLASVRTGDEQPGPDAVQHALREVISRCVYGVDINEMALELCKVNLWLEALEPGKPLSFLDHHLKCGNSLLGATPAALADGIPNDAFKPLTGDDKAVVNEYKAQNRNFRKSAQQDMFAAAPEEPLQNSLASAVTEVEELPDDTVEDIEQKTDLYAQIITSEKYQRQRLIADAWCAAFVWRKAKSDRLPHPIHEEVFRTIQHDPNQCPGWMKEEIERLAREYAFLHWHLVFPIVFKRITDEHPEKELTGWAGGFDLMIGNPPWERVKLQEKEWFASRHEGIAGARNKAARGRLINELKEEDPGLYEAFQAAKRRSEGESHLLRNSGRYPLSGRGDVNTYQVFAGLFRTLIGPTGRVGVIVPTGLATDDTMKYFFQDLMDKGSLSSLYDFENRKALFPGVHRSYKFCLLTLTGSSRPATEGADFVFFAHQVGDLRDQDRHFTLTTDDIDLLNPNTKTCPIFRSRKDSDLTKAIYRKKDVQVWSSEMIDFHPKIDMSDESGYFLSAQPQSGARSIPNTIHQGPTVYVRLFESKMVWQHDHRFADFFGCSADDFEKGNAKSVEEVRKEDANAVSLPRYYIPLERVQHRYSRTGTGDGSFLFAVRRLTNATNERTAVFSVVPFVGCGNSLFVINVNDDRRLPNLACMGNSLLFDYCVRNKVGGTNLLQFILEQLPVITDRAFSREAGWENDATVGSWILSRFLELNFTANDLTNMAEYLGYSGPPFHWNRSRRRLILAELDAAFFHLYLGTQEEWGNETGTLLEYHPTPRHAVEYILDTFPIVKRKDIKEFGDYRTKKLVLHVYDRMLESMETGVPYKSILDPPPGDRNVAHSV